MEKELEVRVDKISKEVDELRKEIREMRNLLNELMQIIVLRLEAMNYDDEEEIYYT